MTQSRKDALQGLLDAVTAWDGLSIGDAGSVMPCGRTVLLTVNAYKGDINAALALHNALLPTAQLGVIDTDGGADVRDWDGDQYSAQFDGNPARAWLCAILQALIAECDAIKPPDPRR